MAQHYWLVATSVSDMALDLLGDSEPCMAFSVPQQSR